MYSGAFEINSDNSRELNNFCELQPSTEFDLYLTGRQNIKKTASQSPQRLHLSFCRQMSSTIKSICWKMRVAAFELRHRHVCLLNVVFADHVTGPHIALGVECLRNACS